MPTTGLYRENGEVIVDAAGNQVAETEAQYIQLRRSPPLTSLPTKAKYDADKLAAQLALMNPKPAKTPKAGNDA